MHLGPLPVQAQLGRRRDVLPAEVVPLLFLLLPMVQQLLRPVPVPLAMPVAVVLVLVLAEFPRPPPEGLVGLLVLRPGLVELPTQPPELSLGRKI